MTRSSRVLLVAKWSGAVQFLAGVFITSTGFFGQNRLLMLLGLAAALSGLVISLWACEGSRTDRRTEE